MAETDRTAAKRYISSKREKIVAEIASLQMKLNTFDELLADLFTVQKEINPEIKEEIKKIRGRPRLNNGAEKQVLIALDAAGSAGITARELAGVAQIPVGTASSRLTLLKQSGVALHRENRYFIAHSDKDDNNINQNGLDLS